MKFYRLKLFSLLLAGAMASFVACNKEEPVKATDQEAEEISLVNGRLKFSSQKAFDRTMSILSKQQTPQELDKWEGQWEGFVSMRTAFDQITEQDIIKIATSGTKGYDGYLTITGQGEEKQTVRNIDSHVMATLVNKEGIVLIGEEALTFHYNSLVRIKDYTDTRIAKFADATATSAAEGVRVFPVKRTIIGSRSEPLSGGRQVNCSKEYWHGGAFCCRKRVLGEIYAAEMGSGLTEEGPHRNLGGYTKHQRRSSGIWWADEVPEVRLVLSARGVFPYQFPFSNQDLTAYGSSKVEYSYYPADGSGNAYGFDLYELTGYHSSVCDDWQFRDCYLSYW